MASSSRGGAFAGRMRNAASRFCSDDQALISDMRRTMNFMTEIAVELEKENRSDKVKELADAVVQLADLSEFTVNFSSIVQAFANRYQPGEETTDFHQVFEDELSRCKPNATSDSFVRQFKEAVWNVHHQGQTMPGEEQEDIVMTSTQSSILNITCPLTGKPVTELEEPVRSLDCRHIYEKKIIMQYIRSKQSRCPISGCPKILQADKVVNDPLLLIEIDEMRKMNKESDVQDFTLLNDD